MPFLSLRASDTLHSLPSWSAGISRLIKVIKGLIKEVLKPLNGVYIRLNSKPRGKWYHNRMSQGRNQFIVWMELWSVFCIALWQNSCKVEWLRMIKLSLFWEFLALKLCATSSKMRQQVVYKSNARYGFAQWHRDRSGLSTQMTENQKRPESCDKK